MTYAIETNNLTKSFGKQNAVKELNLAVPYNGIYGFLGPNGAGKTTTIKMIMNIMAPTKGKAAVLGVDSSRLNPETLQRIGYVSENQELPLWMTAKAFLKYCRSFYPSWDDRFCSDLVSQFDLPLERKMSDLSRGMIMKAGLISALAYKPQLLVLDEPFSGLDPVVKEDLISGFLAFVQEQDWTIFLSTHDMEEVERLSNKIGLIDNGRLTLQEETESLLKRFKRIELSLSAPVRPLTVFPDTWAAIQSVDARVQFVESAFQQNSTEKRIRDIYPNLERLEILPMTLREIFVVIAKERKVKSFI